MKRESLEKRKLSAERIEEADEGLFALERERALKKGTFPMIESWAADEELFVLKREILEKTEAFR